MENQFTKYHGTGNDFIIIDDRNESFNISDTLLINQMCSRRFGIGADGLILLRNVEGYDFEMVYFNSDGNQSSMCGNGGRCIVQFAHSLGIFQDKCSFIAIDGPHEATVLDNSDIKLKMSDIDNIVHDGLALVMDTGSPHYVLKVNKVDDIDVQTDGANVRYSKKYKNEGINVNFLEFKDNYIQVATYERGVEDETFSCGTGVTASALAAYTLDPSRYTSPIDITTKGGALKVYFEKTQIGGFTKVWLEGPAVKTFEGEWIGKDK